MNKPTEKRVTTVGCITIVAQIIVVLVGLYFIYKGGYWLGGRWYHWFFSVILVGLVEGVANKIIELLAKASLNSNAPLKWLLWLAGITGAVALWHFAILPLWACITIAVLVSMILSGFFGDIL